jgi:hypothetical protein
MISRGDDKAVTCDDTESSQAPGARGFDEKLRGLSVDDSGYYGCPYGDRFLGD